MDAAILFSITSSAYNWKAGILEGWNDGLKYPLTTDFELTHY